MCAKHDDDDGGIISLQQLHFMKKEKERLRFLMAD